MQIYGFPTFNVLKVLLTAQYCGVSFDYVALDPSKGEHKSPDYLKIHPLGKVPALRDGEFTLFESAAICRYLATSSTTSLYTGNAKQKAHIDQWVDMITQHPGRWLAVFFFNEIVRVKLMQQPANQAEMDEARGFLDQQLPVIEVQLSRYSFLTGDELTIADLIAFAYLYITEITSVSIAAYPAICRWYALIKHSDECQQALGYFPNQQLFS